jgi:hypothetical protein
MSALTRIWPKGPISWTSLAAGRGWLRDPDVEAPWRQEEERNQQEFTGKLAHWLAGR